MKFTFYHNNINVADLDKSIEFYKKALGLKITKETRTANAIGDFNGALEDMPHLRIRRWVFISLMIRMGIGWRFVRLNKFSI